MSLSVKGCAVAGAVLVGGSFLVVGLLNIVVPGYGTAFLQLGDSIYPGYDYAGPAGVWPVIVGTLYGLGDGAIAGAVIAWVYNAVAGRGAPVKK